MEFNDVDDTKVRAGLLFDAYASSGSINLGAGHAKFNLKFYTKLYAANEIPVEDLAKQVDTWMKPQYRAAVFAKLKQIAENAR